MKYCSHCGNEIMDDYNFCPECGTSTNESCEYSIIEHGKRCAYCGSDMPIDIFYCLNCGHQFHDSSDSSHNNLQHSGIWKNKWVALFLCVMFGWMGIHRYYEGKTFTGIIYTLTFGLFGIGWMVDTLIIFSKSNPYRVK